MVLSSQLCESATDPDTSICLASTDHYLLLTPPGLSITTYSVQIPKISPPQCFVRRCYICQGAGSYFNIRSIEVIIANSVIRGWNNTFYWALSQIAAASAGRPKRTRASGNSWEQLLLGGRRPRRPHNSQLLLRLNNTINCQTLVLNNRDFRAENT